MGSPTCMPKKLRCCKISATKKAFITRRIPHVRLLYPKLFGLPDPTRIRALLALISLGPYFKQLIFEVQVNRSRPEAVSNIEDAGQRMPASWTRAAVGSDRENSYQVIDKVPRLLGR